jgi:carbonic anhydrase
MNMAIRLGRLAPATAVAALAAATIAFAIPAAGTQSADATWDYAENGPHTWPENFEECAGIEQSPIDVQEVTANSDNDVEVELAYAGAADVVVFNNTHTIQANVEPGAGQLTMTKDGVTKVFELLQFHLHTPSEHELSGYDQAAELHLVHASATGELAVVGILYEQGRPQSALNKVWRDLPGVDDEREIEVANLPLRRLVPVRVDAYHYMGSLTTPPCTEGVNWFVVDKIDTMSRSQIKAFRDIFSGEDFPSGNARPVVRPVVDNLLVLDVDRRNLPRP